MPLARMRVGLLAVAQFLSIAGDRLHYLALVALITGAAARAGGDPAADLFALGLAMLLPAVLLAPLAGPLVDRWSLVAVLVITDALRAAVTAGLPAAWDELGKAALLAGVFALFALNAFFLPARSAMPLRLVATGSLLRLNAFLALCAVAAGVAATALGGWAVDRLGWRAALYLDAATYGVSALLLAGLAGAGAPVRRRRRRTVSLYWKEVLSGFALVARVAAARRAVLAWMGLWIGGGVLHVAGALHAQRRAGEMRDVGLYLAALGLGVAVSTLWAMRRGSLSPRLALGGGLAGAALGLALFAFSREPAGFTIAAAVCGLAIGPLVASAETELQRAAGARRRARAFAVRDFLARSSFLVGAAGAGLVVAPWGAAAGIGVGAVTLAALAAVLWALPSGPRATTL